MRRALLALLVVAAALADRATTDAEDASTTDVPGPQRSAGDACPKGCQCSAGVEPRVQCPLGKEGGMVEVALEVRDGGRRYSVHCQTDFELLVDFDSMNATTLAPALTATPASTSCAQFPSLSGWAPLAAARGEEVALTVRGCWASAGCVARRVAGGAVVSSLVLRDAPRWRFDAHDAEDLAQLTELGCYHTEYQNASLPIKELAHLKRLRSLTLSGLALSLPGPLPELPLTRLEMSNCRLRSIPPDTFGRLRQLERLYLHANHLEELEDGLFEGLSQLQELGVASNRLSSLPARALATHCPSLSVLSAFANRLHTLPPLTKLKNLTLVEVFYNEVPLAVAAGALAELPALEEVNLRDCGIQALPADLLQGSGALRSLSLAGNQLATLPEGLLRDQGRLQHLELGDNQLAALGPDALGPLGALEELHLDGNRLEELSAGLCDGLGALKVLSANRNRIGRLEHSALRGCGQLRELRLAHNRLTSHWIDVDQVMDNVGLVLNGLRALRTVDLSHNRLSLPPAGASQLTSLQALDLSHNNLTEVADINFLASGVTVDLTHNQIRTLRLSPATERANGSDDAGSGTGVVLIGHNPLECDCRMYPVVMRLLGWRAGELSEPRLDATQAACRLPPEMRGRPLRDVPPAALQCAFNGSECAPQCQCAFRPHSGALEVRCAEVPASRPALLPAAPLELTLAVAPSSLAALEGLRVRTLRLSGLKLRDAPEGPPPEGLRLVDLSDNLLSRPPLHLLAANVSVLVARNPLRCDCARAADVAALQRLSRLVGDYADATCVGGERVRRVSAGQLCAWRDAALAGGALALLGLLAAAAALVALRFRLEAEILLARVGLLRRREEEGDGRTYDAFVSYAHEDEPWVAEALVPRLEAEGLRLCLHSRDWLPGEWISENIAESVAHSRRTIIVLSGHFLRSRWGRLEFQAATDGGGGSGAGAARVVLLMLEDVSKHPELEPAMAAYLRTNTYVRWGEPWFWRKLLHALPHHQERRGHKEAHLAPARSVCHALPPSALLRAVATSPLHPADVLLAADKLDRRAACGAPMADQLADRLADAKELGGLHAQVTAEGKLVNAANGHCNKAFKC